MEIKSRLVWCERRIPCIICRALFTCMSPPCLNMDHSTTLLEFYDTESHTLMVPALLSLLIRSAAAG
eukprot:6207435-Pleurochrysis_carterae.AAC.5